MVNILTPDENGKTYLLTKTQSELSGSLLLESRCFVIKEQTQKA